MDLETFRDAQRRMWSDGDYRPVGRLIEPAAQLLVARADVRAGDRVLDVATGSGSVAVAAARVAGDVVGVDITDAWFDEARRRADAAGVDVTLLVGDAEDLPVDDGAFDVVLSSFGAIFAPRHAIVAGELVRACVPGGTIGLTAWTPGGANEAMIAALRADLPDPPPFVDSSAGWGDPEHVTDLFASYDVDLTFERHALPVTFPTVAAFEAFVFANSGGFIGARRTLEALGRWDSTLGALRRAVERFNTADDGSYATTWEYLVVVARRRA